MRRLLLLALLLTGCPKPAAPPAAPTPPPPASAPAALPTAPGVPATVQGTEPADEIKPVYAGNPTPGPLATRVCSLFSQYPLDRQNACCGVKNTSVSFAAECARVVTLALAGKRVTLDEGKVAACETAYKKQLEDCDLVMSSVAPPPEACQGLFQGTLSPGAVCRSDLECQTGLTCVGLGPTDPGKCSKPAGAGAPCHPIVDPLAVYTRQSLDDDHPSCTSYCNRHQCGDFMPLGSACTFDTQCGPKNRCSAKKCVAGKPALGSKCAGLGDCPFGATCANGTCKPRGKTGAVCTADDQCLGECDKKDGSGHCGPTCPHAFVPVFSQPQHPPKK